MSRPSEQALRELRERRARLAAELAERLRELNRTRRRIGELEQVVADTQQALTDLDAMIARAEGS